MLFIFTAHIIKLFYELHAQPITHIYPSGEKRQYQQSGRGPGFNTASGIDSAQEPAAPF
jgi:hypothetical protein